VLTIELWHTATSVLRFRRVPFGSPSDDEWYVADVPKAIASRRILRPDGTLGPGTLRFAEGLIESLSEVADPRFLVSGIVSPGLVDLQVNGRGRVNVARAAIDVDERAWSTLEADLIASGTVAWCPTIVSSNDDVYRRVEDGERTLRAASTDPRVRPLSLGLHLEGPQLGERPGAHDRRVMGPRSSAWWRSRRVRLVTLGAETEGAASIVAELAGTGTTLSIGHSAPTREQYETVVAAGATMVTHLFNAMSGVENRRPGLAAFALNDERVVAGLIVDGVHVSQELVTIAFRCKPGRIALVSDSVSVEPPIVTNDGAPRLADGTLAGTTLDLATAVRNCVALGISPSEALLAASTTPARTIGHRSGGVLLPGRRADVTVFDDSWSVSRVLIGGDEAL